MSGENNQTDAEKTLTQPEIETLLEKFGKFDDTSPSIKISFINKAVLEPFSKFCRSLFRFHKNELRNGEGILTAGPSVREYMYCSDHLRELLAVDKQGESLDYVVELLHAIRKEFDDIIFCLIDEVNAGRKASIETNMVALARSLGITSEELREKLQEKLE